MSHGKSLRCSRQRELKWQRDTCRLPVRQRIKRGRNILRSSRIGVFTQIQGGSLWMRIKILLPGQEGRGRLVMMLYIMIRRRMSSISRGRRI